MQEYLPNSFSSLQKKLYVGTVDANSAKFILFEKWKLQEIVLWSMAIPGVFPPVQYKKYNLVDWWVINNFPVDLAKKLYPRNKIIWIALHKFKKNQVIDTAVHNLMVNFEIILRSKLLENTKYVDHLFHKEIPISVLSLDKRKWKKLLICDIMTVLKSLGSRQAKLVKLMVVPLARYGELRKQGGLRGIK